MSLPIYRIGHSTRTIDEFIAMLQASDIETLVDVRSIPRSRTNPQFNRDVIDKTLADAGIDYAHLAALGGRRGRSREIAPDVNAFWDNASFHNYADYAMTPAFREGFDTLRRIARKRRCAIMCSEAVWWRCHRRIIADYLIHAGETVLHIVGPHRVEPAHITAAATPGPHGTLVYRAAA